MAHRTHRGGRSREDIWARLSEHLAHKGLRWTDQRRRIVDVFLKADGHPSIEELLAEARKKDPRIGYATVYRTLRLLVESGFAHERRFGDRLTRYERADVEHHDHLICLDCGLITEFEEARIETLQDEVARRHGWSLLRHRHEMYGRCPSCRKAAQG